MSTELTPSSAALPGKDHVRIYKDVVIKSGPIERLRIEAAKTQQAHVVGQECGLFRVPRVKEFDDINGHLVLERIPGIQGIVNTIAFDRGNEFLVSRIGQSLAAIHQQLHIPATMKIRLPADVSGPQPHAFLHGDYSLDNICLSREQTLVILDWQMSRLHGGEANFGTGYFDLAWFVTNLFYLRSRGRRYLFCRPVTELAERFIESYVTHMPAAHSGKVLGGYLDKFVRAMTTIRKSYFSRRRRIRLMFCLPQYRWFIRKCYRLIPECKVVSPPHIQEVS